MLRVAAYHRQMHPLQFGKHWLPHPTENLVEKRRREIHHLVLSLLQPGGGQTRTQTLAFLQKLKGDPPAR